MLDRIFPLALVCVVLLAVGCEENIVNVHLPTDSTPPIDSTPPPVPCDTIWCHRHGHGRTHCEDHPPRSDHPWNN